MIPSIVIAGKPLQFVGGICDTLTFRGRSLKVFQNSTRRLSFAFGYILYDFDGSVLKRCPCCSAYAVGEAVMSY